MPRSLPSNSARPRRPLRLLAGAAVGIGIAGLIVLVLWSIAATAATEPGTGTSRVDVIGLLVMTGTQAGLTTILSLCAGIAVAWALNRLRFPGRDLIVGLFASAIVTPGIIIAFGVALDGWEHGENGQDQVSAVAVLCLMKTLVDLGFHVWQHRSRQVPRRGEGLYGAAVPQE